ncbi:MAG TPA: hypothetical protein VII39_08435 [Bradyrhizobium sp.]
MIGGLAPYHYWLAGNAVKAGPIGIGLGHDGFSAAWSPFRGYEMQARIIDPDPIQPTAIEHKCDDIHNGDMLEQQYNYLVYHFDSDGAYFLAKTYLDDVRTVSLHGPFASRTELRPTGAPLCERVLTYLRRRFRTIQILQKDGFVSI